MLHLKKLRPTKNIGLGLLLLGLASCNTVRPYNKQYLNDPDMELSQRSSERYETSFQIYREGAAGANSGKSGGGCGCN